KTVLGLVTGTVISTLLAYPWLVFPDDSDVAFALPAYGLGSLLNCVPAILLVLIFSVPLGILAHAALYALRRRAFWYYLLSGAVGGILLVAVIGFGRDNPLMWFFAAGWAAACALIAWLIRRPDKDDRPPAENHF
ncbi:MAG: hypothetical protein JF615_03160, partial [Asticcacaulis sp.]|nr:hypothetical protein [Asticcacaulis sp.]